MHCTSRPRRARILSLFVVVLFAAGAAACDSNGTEDEDAATGSGDAAGTSEEGSGDDSSDTDSEAVAASGEGEVVIAGTTYAFTSESCAIGDEDVPLVAVTGTGNSGGREYEVEIDRSKPADNYVERVKVAWSGTEASVSTKIGPESDASFEVDDRELTATGVQFTGAGKAPSGEGTVTVTCEAP